MKRSARALPWLACGWWHDVAEIPACGCAADERCWDCADGRVPALDRVGLDDGAHAHDDDGYRERHKRTHLGAVVHYLSPVYVGYLQHKGQMPANGTGTIEAGRLGKIQVQNYEVLLGAPMVFDRENIDKFDF